MPVLRARSAATTLQRLAAVSHQRRSLAAAAATDASAEPRPVTVAYGDGIGPEIMEATLKILDAAGANIRPEIITIGENIYKQGVTSGIADEGWDSLDRTKLFLKAPITTPLGGGVKSLNVTVRKTLGLYANVRPVVSYHPYVPALHKHMDMLIVRENEEDCYAGIEHRQTSEVTQCIKLITVPGTQRVCQYAFDLAKEQGRKKVTCVTKNNIMKLTDGLFADVFSEVAKQHPSLQTEHRIVDIATAQVASKPHFFDVIVTLNLYGDIISDVAAEVAGSVGLCGSANIGDHAAMFEAVHGSAPDIAGQDMANPGGLLNGAVMMLSHIGQRETAVKIKNAFLTTIEDGLHTADIYQADNSTKRVGTKEFADAVIERLGAEPKVLKAESLSKAGGNAAEQEKKQAAPKPDVIKEPIIVAPPKSLVGCDLFVDWENDARNPDDLASMLRQCENGLELQMISNRGVKVWPDGHDETFKVNHWRCRFVAPEEQQADNDKIWDLMRRLTEAGVDVIKTENLYNFGDEAGYSRGQGQ